MIVKLFEVRDRATLIPVMAVQISGEDGPLMRSAGFDNYKMVYLVHLNGQTASYDPFKWTNRTMKISHLHIQEHFDTLESGAVVDVEYIMKETDTPKVSEVGQ
ncbi:hypothetical protein UFOVP1196_21 [uncultured Caudovirales phage]|uniref:Uncharacterized protein n=1 Tax=uncultured Caudovirales phage TaxID=2100421 RepID=A0A6J5QZ66_9CAUD|nr:hypothetical protein UFOVP1196_21 [uncultured Caudovirales phage]